MAELSLFLDWGSLEPVYGEVPSLHSFPTTPVNHPTVTGGRTFTVCEVAGLWLAGLLCLTRFQKALISKGILVKRTCLRDTCGRSCGRGCLGDPAGERGGRRERTAGWTKCFGRVVYGAVQRHAGLGRNVIRGSRAADIWRGEAVAWVQEAVRIEANGGWQKLTGRLAGYPPGTRYAFLMVQGKDTNWWRGWYGAKLLAPCLSFEAPE
jgi:hypothetical protein